MSRRLLLLLTAVLAAVALPVSPALAGEDDPTPIPAPVIAPAPEIAPSTGLATLHSQDCVSRARAKATVTGELIASVAFYVDGDLVKTISQPDSAGRYSLTMICAHLHVGAHRGKAVVTFQQAATPAGETLRFQITRSRQGTARFAG
jgi:hypothetical protein